MSSKRRDKITIIYEMLKAIINKGGIIKPTHLLYKSNLSYKRMMPLVDELMKKGMITQEIRGNKKSYIITDEGRRFVNEYKKMKEFVESFGF
ncbi:MAG: winged helix-turn-helix domain-containing protein [Candidatus Nanoarchaeia archaeon]